LIKSSTMRISVKGKPVEVPCLLIEGRTIIVRGRILRIAGVFDDFLDSRDIDDPEPIIRALKENRESDIFNFLGSFSVAVGEKERPAWQTCYQIEYDHLAAIRVVSFERWWTHDIKKQARRKVKKAKEKNVTVCQVPLDDQLLKGIVRIFNEMPVRQERPFWHYGKGFRQVKEEISTYADRSIFLGAYCRDELIGFAKLINCGDFGRANQLISMVKHRDKPVTNALIAELVRTCESKSIPYLVYGAWFEGSLGHFKKNNGFKKVAIPRYYNALTFKGRVALRLGIHKGVREFLPDPIRKNLRSIRRVWYR